MSPADESRGNPGVGVNVRGVNEQLGLIADPTVLPAANGSDIFPGGLSPGFSSGYGNTVAPAPSAFHFALFSFDQPVDIPGVTVDDVANFDRDIWMGTSTTAPDFTSGFLTGIASFDIVNSPDDISDGLFTHSLPSLATDISHFLVGAPPLGADLGPILGAQNPSVTGSNFFIDSFEGTPSMVDPIAGPGPTPVPEPATLGLLVSGLLGIAGILRHKRIVSLSA